MLGGTLWGAAQLDWFRAGAHRELGSDPTSLTRTGKMGSMQEIAINYKRVTLVSVGESSIY